MFKNIGFSVILKINYQYNQLILKLFDLCKHKKDTFGIV